MILEAIISTTMPDGSAHISPMGPIISDGFSRFELRPFEGSQTLANLRVRRAGVLHVTDDVMLFAQAISNCWVVPPELVRATAIDGWIIVDACRWYEFEVSFVEQSTSRCSLQCKTVVEGVGRDFFGFNRAKHAVLEAAIVVSRRDFLPAIEIDAQLERATTIVAKTGGQKELAALDLLVQCIKNNSPSSKSLAQS